VHVSKTGICGTDLMIYRGKHPRSVPPLIPGHEVAGEIVEAAEGSGLKAGDRVVVNPLISCGNCIACRMGTPHICQTLQVLGNDLDGSFAEYLKTTPDKIYRLPQEISMERASLVEPAAVAYHAVMRSQCAAGDVVVVQGAGPIGILAAMIAEIAGASKIIITEVQKYRLKMAEQYGFIAVDTAKHDVVETVRSITDGRFADIVINAAAVPQAAAQFASLIRPRGKIVIVGLFKEPTPVELVKITFKEGNLIGSRVYPARDFERAAELIISGKLDADPLITHRLDLEEAERGIDLLERGENVMKVVLST
jgi:2-desacetyl-2-hydroxyethyl bacteriochlorophyllide A dehydrogenase